MFYDYLGRVIDSGPSRPRLSATRPHSPPAEATAERAATIEAKADAGATGTPTERTLEASTDDIREAQSEPPSATTTSTQPYTPSHEEFNLFTCAFTDTLCDGFAFDTIQECVQHEQDWHSGPYKCFICGQVFASGPRLRRHGHYVDSEERREATEKAEVKRGNSSVAVYHGNQDRRRRARRFAKMVLKDEGVSRGAEGGDVMEEVQEVAYVHDGSKGVAVTTADDGLEEGEDNEQKCEEPCCPHFGRNFRSERLWEKHVQAQKHTSAVAMGEALLEQMAGLLASSNASAGGASADMQMTGAEDTTTGAREATPEVRPSVDWKAQLLSPPPTPHEPAAQVEAQGDWDAGKGLPMRLNRPQKRAHPDDWDEAEAQPMRLTRPQSREWDGTERLPMRLAARLRKTQRALREMRCNVPRCPMFGRRLASSQCFWDHLASEAHVLALRAWSGEGGDAVYVKV